MSEWISFSVIYLLELDLNKGIESGSWSVQTLTQYNGIPFPFLCGFSWNIVNLVLLLLSMWILRRKTIVMFIWFPFTISYFVDLLESELTLFTPWWRIAWVNRATWGPFGASLFLSWRSQQRLRRLVIIGQASFCGFSIYSLSESVIVFWWIWPGDLFIDGKVIHRP